MKPSLAFPDNHHAYTVYLGLELTWMYLYILFSSHRESKAKLCIALYASCMYACETQGVGGGGGANLSWTTEKHTHTNTQTYTDTDTDTHTQTETHTHTHTHTTEIRVL
jgi:carbohydrate-binding DOMON domain-containing protein